MLYPNNDFVEIHNRDATPVTLTGRALQLNDEASTGSWTVVPLSGTLAGGGYYLVVLGRDNTETGIALPTADATGTYNLASGRSYSLLDLVAAINEFLGTDIEPLFGPVRAGDVKYSQADITLARNVLGFEPSVAFRDGLERTIESFRAACTAGA